MPDYKKGNYEIGYQRPPRFRQFPKGKSGNPKGRPRKQAPEQYQENIDQQIIELMMGAPTTFPRGKKSQPFIITLIQRLQADALKGNRTAQKMLLNWFSEVLGRNEVDKARLRKMMQGYRQAPTFIDMILNIVEK